MDGGIDNMIANGVVLADEPIQCKRQAGDRSIKAACVEWSCEQGLPQRAWHEVVDVQRCVFDDIGHIIEKPWRIEGVAVGGKNKKRDDDEWEKRSV